MNRIAPLISFFIIVACTYGMGHLHGQLTNRWGLQTDTRLAAERLRVPLPNEVGSWRLRHEDQFSPSVVRILQCPTHIIRAYEHLQTGDTANVAVIVGPPGPTSVHTAEICYSSRDFAINGDRRRIAVTDADGKTHSLWDLPLKSNELNGMPLRVVYAWSTGTTWEAAQYPRFAYGGLPYLYKLQVAISANPGSQLAEHDAAQDFLGDFLTQLQPRLVEANASRLRAK